MTNEVLNTMKTRRSCRCYLDKMPEPEALNVIAMKADGGMRDALSIFDQVVKFHRRKYHL